MSILRSTLAVALLVSIPAIGLAQEFPQAPPKLKEAETQGLPRVSTEELKEFLPGKLDGLGPLGHRIKTFKSDGSVDRTSYSGKKAPDSGTWRFDEANNTYCQTFRGKMGSQEDCFAVFRAPDGTHFFDYDVKTGFFERTWRRVTE